MPVILVIAGLNALPFLDGSRSTRLILQGKAAEDRTIPIIFPYGVPSSANFYAPDQVVHQPAEGMGPFRAELHDLQPDLYILRMQEWEKLPETVRKRLRPVERVGKWLLAGEVP